MSGLSRIASEHSGGARDSSTVYFAEDLLTEEHVRDATASRVMSALRLEEQSRGEVVAALLVARAALLALGKECITAVTVRVRRDGGPYWSHVHCYR